MFHAKLPCMLSPIPGERVQKLLIDDRRLKAVNHVGISQRRSGVRYSDVAGYKTGRNPIAGNRESRERCIRYTRQSYFRGQIFTKARPFVDELAAQIAVAKFVCQPAAESVCIGGE